MQCSAKMTNSAQFGCTTFVLLAAASAFRSILRISSKTKAAMEVKNFEREAVEVARKVLMCALGQLEQAQALVDQAQEKYWSAVEKYRSASNLTYSECESVEAPKGDCPVRDIQQCDLTPDSQQNSKLNQVNVSEIIAGAQSDNSTEPTSFVHCADVTPTAVKHAESRRRSIESMLMLAAEYEESDSLPNSPSPSAHTPSDACVERGESRENDSPPSPPSPQSPRAQVLELEATEWDKPRQSDHPPSPLRPRINTVVRKCVEREELQERDKPTSPCALTNAGDRAEQERTGQSDSQTEYSKPTDVTLELSETIPPVEQTNEEILRPPSPFKNPTVLTEQDKSCQKETETAHEVQETSTELSTPVQIKQKKKRNSLQCSTENIESKLTES